MTSLSVDRRTAVRAAGTEQPDVRERATQTVDLSGVRTAAGSVATAGAQRPDVPEPAVEQPATAPPRQRDRYVDTLRAVALFRVMTYHSFGWAWLPLLFPSMGIMFALAGSLVAASLDRSPGNPWRVLQKRTVRLLPPVWLLGLVVVPVMLLAGWTHTAEAGSPLNVRTLLLWVLPLSDPPGSALGEDWVLPLWYVRTYLWFLLLSPMALWLFRHWPRRMLALPVAAVVLWTVGALPLEGRSGDVVLSLATFGGCWMLGFAHHDGRIRRLPALPVVAGGLALMGLGLAYALTHQDPATGYDIDNIPLADMLYCLGAVLVLLRFYPDFSWMTRHVVLDRLVSAVNARAMTIYLWGNLAIFLAHPLLDTWSVTADLDNDDAVGATEGFLAAWLVLVGCVVAFGWCEDVAARRPVRIIPWSRTPGQTAVPAALSGLAAPVADRLRRVPPRRLALGTAVLVVAAAGLSALALVGTRTPARTAPADVQSLLADQPPPRPSRTDAGPRTDGPRVPRRTAPASSGSGAGSGSGGGGASDGSALVFGAAPGRGPVAPTSRPTSPAGPTSSSPAPRPTTSSAPVTSAAPVPSTPAPSPSSTTAPPPSTTTAPPPSTTTAPPPSTTTAPPPSTTTDPPPSTTTDPPPPATTDPPPPPAATAPPPPAVTTTDPPPVGPSSQPASGPAGPVADVLDGLGVRVGAAVR